MSGTFCTSCGAINSAEAVFCQKCGKTIVVEDETRVAVRQADSVSAERVLFSIGPTLLFVKIGYFAAAILGLVFVALIAVFNSFYSFATPVAVALGLAFLLIPAFHHIKRRLIRYTLTDSKIQIDSGLIAKTTRNIPIQKIQDVTVVSTLTQRLFGFGSLIIDNASETDSKIVMRNIDSPTEYADAILKEIHKKH